MKMLNKLKNNYLAKCSYIKYIKRLKIKDNLILLESQQSKEYGGNMYYLARELLLNSAYRNYIIYLCVEKNKVQQAKTFYIQRGLDNIHIIQSNTRKYYKLVASAKYLMSDNTFLPFFIKKEGQIYLNTWHGTPLKSLGKKINNDMHNIGNAQKNFLCADYLLYPNEYTKKHMIEDYMIENLCENHCLLTGYPRNTAFFNDELKDEIKKRYQLGNKTVIAYMPTWRGTLGNKSNPIVQANINYILEEFDKNLSDNQIVYVNLHPIESSSVDFSLYKKVKPFPTDYETYEFLNVADVLVSDYSSVFFDYLNTGKKVILYTYDKEDYLSSRGVYRPLEDFPFPIVESMKEVISEINKPKDYQDDVLRQEFCCYDGKEVCSKICERIILGKCNDISEQKINDNKKENVFIFAGRLASNGITASLKNLIHNINRDEKNYYLIFDSRAAGKNLDTLKEMNKYVEYLSIKGLMNMTIIQKICMYLYKAKIIKTERYMKIMEDAYQYELKRIFGCARVDTIIQFTGYSTNRINLFSQFKGNNVIYVHANMLEEIKLRNNQRLDVLQYAYRTYNKVAVVTEDMIEPTYQISKRRDNIYVCRNVIDYERIIHLAELPLEIEEKTIVWPNTNRLMKILENDNKKFINVGRFSPEKGQIRLLNAFANFQKEYPNTNLIIVGGSSYKDHYNQIINHIESLELEKHVVLVKTLSNPFPLVKKCDFSVLSSFAEGFGLVIAEADVLNISVFSVDIPGPRTFMKKYNGTLVKNNEEGIYTGLEDCMKGNIKPMHVNYAQYNKEAVKEFEKLLSYS